MKTERSTIFGKAVHDLYRALIQPKRKIYNQLREQLIAEYGYDWFRDAQNAAAKLIWAFHGEDTES